MGPLGLKLLIQSYQITSEKIENKIIYGIFLKESEHGTVACNVIWHFDSDFGLHYAIQKNRAMQNIMHHQLVHDTTKKNLFKHT